MDQAEIDNWKTIAKSMEANGDTESWFYLRARAIAEGKPDPLPNISELMPESAWSDGCGSIRTGFCVQWVRLWTLPMDEMNNGFINPASWSHPVVIHRAIDKRWWWRFCTGKIFLIIQVNSTPSSLSQRAKSKNDFNRFPVSFWPTSDLSSS